MNKHKEEVLSGLKSWALKHKDIYSVIVTGSQARDYVRSDEYSDIDVIVFCRNRYWFDNNPVWMKDIATPVAYYTDRVLLNQMGNKIFFANAIAMDIVFLDIRMAWWGYVFARASNNRFLSVLMPRVLKRNFENGINAFAYNVHRGFYSVVDKKDYDRQLHYIEERFRHKKDKFFNLGRVNFIVNKFWHHSYLMSIKMYRGDLLSAKIECDNGLKICLLNMMELHAKSLKGGEFDTLHNGRKITEWGDPAFTSRLKYVYGHYDLADSWRCLEETIDLFCDVLSALQQLHPGMAINNPEEHVRKWINDIKNKTSLNKINLINN
jgi:aminoglycoside 6-adenylyltransferase